ncbi:MAG: RdgB/HAM1 family non-canonical purine NTP pyrophosphatase [Bacteroidetes bacterium]|jgi:XTP/dITP diphosphohydrolase|nr:RdgB/HAM1 family non-canonical purine NTP pyrophosphatase [Bacteroidota bacterium]
MKLVLASRNRHKMLELRSFLQDLPVEVVSVDDVAPGLTLVEDGSTFVENALKKARTVFAHTKIPSLADDSGLEVFFLNARPGVISARYAGDGAGDEANNKKLLREMRGVAARRRHAQFCAVLALVGPGYEEIAVGTCPGTLTESSRGTNGFGYDPIFQPEGFSRTYAELSQDEKNRISHRARAFAALRDILKRRLT